MSGVAYCADPRDLVSRVNEIVWERREHAALQQQSPAPARQAGWGRSVKPTTDHRSPLTVAWLAACFALAALGAQGAQDKAAPAVDEGPRLTVRLAPAEATAERVDARESVVPIFSTDMAAPADPKAAGATAAPTPIGERVTLWVRGARVTGAKGSNTFERYYQGKYIDRASELSVPFAALGAGEQVITPGGHRFTITQENRVTSADPDIVVAGSNVTLKVYGIDIMAARANEVGPVEWRLQPETFGLFLAPTNSPDNPKVEIPLLSRGGAFCPLRVYLPANTQGAGYLLQPYGQTFRVLPGGKVELTGGRMARVTAEGSRIVAEYATFQGRVVTKTGLGAGLGSGTVSGNSFVVRPSHRPLRFTAGFGLQSPAFGLPVDPDTTRRPFKYFVADNMGERPADVRLLALEMDSDVLSAGELATVSLRFVENDVELRMEDVVESPPTNAPAAATTAPAAGPVAGTNAPAMRSGWELILVPLRVHNPATAKPAHPFTALRRHFETADAGDAEWNAWKPFNTENRTSVMKARQRVLNALDLAIHDPHFYDPEGFAGIELSAASRAAVARGIAELPPPEQRRANRSLLADLFPGAFRPFNRVPSIKQPAVRAEWSAYRANLPTQRVWTPFEVKEWRQGEGALSFKVPDLPPGFYYVRLMVVDGADTAAAAETALYGELPTAVIRSGQTGSASIVSPKARDAFVAGETVRLEAVIRSADARRPAGNPAVVLTHPSGRTERMPFADAGGAWCAQPLELSGATTRHLPPGRYELSFTNLSAGVVPWPMAFDLVGPDPRTLYTIVKAHKYTGNMDGLIASWYGRGGGNPIDIDRAVRSLAELGYNRIELTGRGDRRAYTEREVIAARDPRLPPPEAVYQPSARDRLLNACVRNGMQFADELLYYNDFHIPRYIEPYIKATERWIARETSAMRHSPAFDGIYIYQEMYEWGKMGVVDSHTELWPRTRDRVAAEKVGARPSEIRNAMGRELRRPRTERDPNVLKRFLELRRFEIAGWGDYNSRAARAVREVAPRARVSTYNQAFLQVTAGLGAVSSGVDMDCGFRPDVFRDLDIRNIIHYQDGPCGGWIHSPMLVDLLRYAPRRPVWINYPVRVSNYMPMPQDGQYERRMTFAFLAEGADGVSLYGREHSFADGPNLSMMKGKETTGPLNREVLEPFGELVTATEPGYRRVGIVHTENQMILSEFKELRTANQIEEIWLACWRLGFPAVFLREDAFEQPLDGLDVIFVPGIRFDGELGEQAMQRLREAIARGAHVVVERNSALQLDGIERLEFDFNNYFLGPGYNPGGWEDEVYRLFRYTQPTVEFLAARLAKWTQPAARGPFSVGPNWRRGGDIHYLVMGNYEMVGYSAALKQVMSRPTLLPLTVGADRGRAAYDLLYGKPLPLEKDGDGNRLTVDMTRVGGAMVAFVPEAVAGLRTEVAFAADGGSIRVGGTLTGASGKEIAGVFPARITLTAEGCRTGLFYRAIGGGRTAELQLPGGGEALTWRVEVREGLTGLTVGQSVARPAVAGATLRPLSVERAYVPYPDEVRRFWKDSKEVLLAVGDRTAGMKAAADAMEQALVKRGVKVTRKSEREAFLYFGGGGMEKDALADGFHTWGGYGEGQQPIRPMAVVDAPLVLLASAGGSSLLQALEESRYLSLPTLGGAGLVTQATVQRARRPFHTGFDTLCLIANDPEGMRRAVDAALGDASDAPAAAPARASYGTGQRADTARQTAAPPPAERIGNNEMITDIRFDAAGNSYLSTWGHGDNLYSLAPDGAVRFSHYLAELGPYALDKEAEDAVGGGGNGGETGVLPGFALGVYGDRIMACTAVGARLYQVGLDGKPIWQMRLSRDNGVGEERTAYWPVFRYAEPTRLVVYRDDMNGAMRIIDQNGSLVASWQGEEYEDPEDPAAGRRREFHGFAISPDGQRLAQIESTQYGGKGGAAFDSYLVVRDMTGRKVAQWPEIIANEVGGVSVGVRWRDGDPGPAATVGDEVIRFDAGLTREVGRERILALASIFDLGEGGVLQRADSRNLRWVGRDGRERARLESFATLPSLAQLSPDAKTFFFLDEYGQASFYDAGTGRRRCAFTVPELGSVARFTPDSGRLVLGGFRGTVLAYGLDGKLLWQRGLAGNNRAMAAIKPLDKPAGFPTPAMIPATDVFVDHTEKQWPSLVDEPGQIEKLVTLDPDRLVNGDAAGSGGWKTQGAVAYAEPGFADARCLRVGTNLVTQEVTGFIGNHFTWVLEFRYRRAPGSAAARLTAGLRAQSREASRDPLLVARRFDADDTWRFARIVTKSGAAAEALGVGFRSAGGEALVDNVSLRRIRFPSVNHMLYEPLHDITPRILATPRFMEIYDPIGRMREAIPNRIIIENLKTISQNLVDSAFLQNGRLNDVGSDWYIYPFGPKTDIGLGLREPRWISMVGVYFNAYDEANITPHYDIFVTDLNARQTRLVASVRNNRQLFQLTTFAPRLADAVTVRLVNTLTRQRTVTEIEVYGPLSGQEGRARFVDAEGQNTYMGNFARVDRRPRVLGQDYAMNRGSVLEGVGGVEVPKLPIWNYPATQPLLGENRMHMGRALGYVQGHALNTNGVRAGIARANALGFGNPGALYGGVWLLPGNDGILYGIDLASSRTLWSVPLGERLRSGPVAIGNDVFAASDTGKLCAFDLGSGALLREAQLSGGVVGSLATDDSGLVFISEDGQLQCWDAASFKRRWSVPVAPWSESTPAIDDGVVYAADRLGVARAVRMTDGTALWSRDLKDEFSRCPVVADTSLYLGFRSGRLSALNRADGAVRWEAGIASRFDHEPLPVTMKDGGPGQEGRPVLLVVDSNKLTTVEVADGAKRPWEVRAHGNDKKVESKGIGLGDPPSSFSYYRGMLYMIDRSDGGHGELSFGGPLHQYQTGCAFRLAPMP